MTYEEPARPRRLIWAVGYLQENLRLLRAANQLSQERLAEMTDVHPTQISHLEAGRRVPSLRWLGRAAEVFDCEIADLLSPVSFEWGK